MTEAKGMGILLIFVGLALVFVSGLALVSAVEVRELRLQLKVELEQRDFLIQTNKSLTCKIDTILKRQSGYKTFGYPIHLPNGIKGHVILHYDEKANFNVDQEDFLISTHWTAVSMMSMKHWNEMEKKKAGEEK